LLAGVRLLAIFVVQNRERLTLPFLFWDFAWPLRLFALTVALIGASRWDA
jgi:uncharacterized integral membrane protein